LKGSELQGSLLGRFWLEKLRITGQPSRRSKRLQCKLFPENLENRGKKKKNKNPERGGVAGGKTT